MLEHARKTHVHLVLEALSIGNGPMTTAELSVATRIELRRLGEVIHGMVEEHTLEQGPRRSDGWSWMLTDVGLVDLARCEARFTGGPIRLVGDPDEAVIDLNLRRGTGQR